MGHYFTNENLPSEIRTIKTTIREHEFLFYTDNGVFSKTSVDFGSRLLLESIPLDEVGGKVLDMGCGYGVIGIVISKLTLSFVDMCDVNLRAIHLTKRNILLNKCDNTCVFESDCYSNITSKYNTIITNPPIRAGKKVLYEILLKAKDYLEVNGNLFLVVRKDQGAKSLIFDLEKIYNVSILKKKNGFLIIKCTF